MHFSNNVGWFKKKIKGLRWYLERISGLVVLTVSILICWLQGSAMWDNLPSVPSKCDMSEAYLIKWANKVLTSAWEWLKCRHKYEKQMDSSSCAVQFSVCFEWNDPPVMLQYPGSLGCSRLHASPAVTTERSSVPSVPTLMPHFSSSSV